MSTFMLCSRCRAAVLLVSVFLLAFPLAAQDSRDNETPNFFQRHQAGIRLGFWGNLGDTPESRLTQDNRTLTSEIGDASAYMEGFGAFRFSPSLMAELSVGVVSRGDVQAREGETTTIGSLLVYPILAKARFYPLGASAARFHPYLLAGGGIYHASYDVQFATLGNDSFFAVFDSDSETKFSFVVGGGFDWPVAETIALEANAQYMPIEFGNEIIGADNWSSLTITVGVKYLALGK